MITKGFKALVAEAEAEIETSTVEDAKRLVGTPGAQFSDIRDIRESTEKILDGGARIREVELDAGGESVALPPPKSN